MALENEAWRLSVAERMQTRESGIHDVLAEHVGGNRRTFNVLAAGNVMNKTIDGDKGHMLVSVSWTQHDRWHLHNLRFEGGFTAGLDQKQLDILGAISQKAGRLAINDYTRNMYGQPLRRPEPEVMSLEIQPVIEDMQPAVLANAAA